MGVSINRAIYLHHNKDPSSLFAGGIKVPSLLNFPSACYILSLRHSSERRVFITMETLLRY